MILRDINGLVWISWRVRDQGSVDQNILWDQGNNKGWKWIRMDECEGFKGEDWEGLSEIGIDWEVEGLVVVRYK